MEHPVQVAFCLIYFGANGGTFDELGRPIFKERDEDGFPVRGKCDRPFDCGTCHHLGKWVLELQSQGWDIGWECYQCLKDTKKTDTEENQRFLPGHYQAGRKQDLKEEDQDYDPDQPPLEGCTRCGWSTSFLQLVLRRKKGGP